MNSNNSFPQDWPKHLARDANVVSIDTGPSRGAVLLDFTNMDPTTFEQFCWWLLTKSHNLVGCKRLGGSGTRQEGIDIFGYDAATDGRVHVFECKAWEKFTPARMTEAVDAFLEGEWSSSADSFTLILAQRDAGSALLKRWQSERQRLKRVGIEGDLWTAHKLTQKVQNYPDILTKFFPFHTVATFANLWMERVAFYELVNKSFFDPREHVARWARQFMGEPRSRGEYDSPVCDPATSASEIDSVVRIDDDTRESPSSQFIDDTYRRITQVENSWHFKGPWFDFSAILPDARFSRASAAITFNRPDMQGVVLTVDHSWLLTQFLFKVGAPLRSPCREFILGEFPASSAVFMLDLPHCRFHLQEAGVSDFLKVADHLTIAMREALLGLEEMWSAGHRPFVMRGGRKVAVAAVSKPLWRAICQFSLEHDVAKGSTPWHMFDGHRQLLRPYHQTTTEQFDTGYHGIFFAEEIDDLSHSDEVVLLWQPNGSNPELDCSSRGWWSCDFTFTWLRDELLPEVKRWAYQREFRTRWSQLLKSAQSRLYVQTLEEIFVIRDLRTLPLTGDGQLTQSIVESVHELQAFFNMPTVEHCFIRPGEIEGLYEATALAAQAGRGYVGYAASKLAIQGNPENHPELIDCIRQEVKSGRIRANSGTADHALRALLEMLNDSDTHLNDADRRGIANSLVPFAKIFDEAMFIQRHTKWG